MNTRIWSFGVLAAVAVTFCGCPETRRPSGGTTPPPAQTAPAKASEGTKAGEAKGPVADYARNLSAAKKKATEVTGMETVTKAVQQFQVIEGRYPATLDELVATRYLPKLPAAPRGKRFIYNPRSGEVTLENLPAAPVAAPASAAPTDSASE